MEHQTDQFTDQNGASIACQSWLPDVPARAALVVVHGLGEHSGRYGNLVDHLVPQGYALYGFDLPGHGRSSGKRLYVQRFSHYLDALDAYIERVRQDQPQLPLFVLGHSVGGLIAAAYLGGAERHEERQARLSGAILSSPAVSVPDNVGPLVLLASKVLSAVAPRIGVKELVVPDWLCHDPQVVRAYVDDPLVSSEKVTARLGAELLAAQEQVMLDARRIVLPILVIQGSLDRVASPSGTHTLYETIRSTDKSIHIYDGLYHECMNEPERAQVLADLQNWLDAHLDRCSQVHSEEA